MQKVFEKIKKRVCEFVHERNKSGSAPCKNQRASCLQLIRVCDLTAIINQVAEEYSDGWIPFKQREADVEEKEIFGCETMLDCKLPEDGEEIFVTHKFKDKLYVCGDTFMRDGSECYLESGLEFVSEAIAWQPLPEPYKEGICKQSQTK